jgi:hypothetical protein
MMKRLITIVLIFTATNAGAFGFVGGGGGVGASTASAVSNTPSGSISATNVQGAIDELEDEKQRIAADEVYATDYNGGALNSTTINAAMAAIGASVKTLVLTPGDWAMSASITAPETTTLKLQPGAKLVRSSGTLTINGPINFPRQLCLEGFTSGSIVWGNKVEDIYIDWQALADGSDDYPEIQSLITTVKSGTNIHFGVEKSYNIGTSTLTLSTFSGGDIYGYGSRIYGNNTAYGILSIYNQLSNNTAQTITVTEDVATFTIPGGISVPEGSMVRLIPGTPYVWNYYAGHMARVVTVSGSTATLDIPPLNSFTATTLDVFTGVHKAEIHDLTFDSSTATTAITSVNIYGSNSKIKNCRFLGADNAAAGLSVYGNNIDITDSYADGYLNKVGVSGGRTGYGISVSGNNINIDRATLKNCKHNVSFGGDRYVMSNNNTVNNSLLWQDPAQYDQELTIDAAQHAYFSTALDAHSNIEQWSASNNTIVGSSVVGVVSVRNGKGTFSNNTIRQASSDANGNIFVIGERPLNTLALNGNDIAADTAGAVLVRTATNPLDWIGSASPYYASEQAVKHVNNSLTNLTWKGCTVQGDKLLASAAPTTFAWDLNDFVHNSNQTVGSVLGWRCVVAGTPGTWEAITVPSDTAYGAAWNGSTVAPSKNAVYDKIETLIGAVANTTVSVTATSTDSLSPINITRSAPDLAISNTYNIATISTTATAASPAASSVITGLKSNPVYSGIGTLPQINGFLSSPRNTGAGTTTQVVGYTTDIRNSHASGTASLIHYFAPAAVGLAGTIPSVYGFWSDNQGRAGTTTSYGAKIENQSGSTTNYAIYTGTGLVRFGDAVTSTSTITGTQLTSTVSTGTAPLVVASITEVANLKSADSGKLNGQAGSYYATAASVASIPTTTYTTAQFDKTDSTLAVVTGLPITVEASGKYAFRAVLHVLADSTGGLNASMGGTATATSVVAARTITYGTSLIHHRLTALGSGTGMASLTVALVVLEGQITVNAGGTLSPTFSQFGSSGTSSVLAGSTFTVAEIP